MGKGEVEAPSTESIVTKRSSTFRVYYHTVVGYGVGVHTDLTVVEGLVKSCCSCKVMERVSGLPPEYFVDESLTRPLAVRTSVSTDPSLLGLPWLKYTVRSGAKPE